MPPAYTGTSLESHSTAETRALDVLGHKVAARSAVQARELGQLGSTQYGIRVCVEPIDPSSPDLDDELDTLIRVALSLEAWYETLAIP